MQGTMLMRVGLLLVVTGLTFILVGWLGVIGPAMMIVGSGCAAVAVDGQFARDAAGNTELGAAAVDPTIRGDQPTLPDEGAGASDPRPHAA
jgi:hypothetical protein